ncbi:MAG: 4Fe-4S binding protein, partial [bacterium]
GWIGRNNMLVNKDFGAQFRLVTILTNMPLVIDKPTGGGLASDKLEGNGLASFGQSHSQSHKPAQENCGLCRLCVDVCPAKAIQENVADFDHIKCFDAIKGFQKLHLAEQYICGVCVNVCCGKTSGKKHNIE